MPAIHQRFLSNLMKKLDKDDNGRFDLEEFAIAFSELVDDSGEFIEPVGISGAQIFALSKEFEHIHGEKVELLGKLDEFKKEMRHEKQMLNEKIQHLQQSAAGFNQQTEDYEKRLDTIRLCSRTIPY